MLSLEPPPSSRLCRKARQAARGSLLGHRRELVAQTLCCILHRLASLVFGGDDGLDEGGALGLCQPHFKELVELVPTPAARLLVVLDWLMIQASVST